ncbi:Protein LSM12-like A [Pseudocercospora fuligena]|uniref:Protein LSM12-like A n=1 Tax=Pseudocercospora fuligena TaxID=685502 RepID=A0A8H6VJS5_9PEZI|nr:Protein LSM12-like A [Pseudocercospora fuligena]
MMADAAKRNSVAGNKAQVATPKSATPTPDNGIEALEKAIGARVRITTTAPTAQTYEGTLFTADPTLSLVAINIRPQHQGSQTGDYNVIPFSRIDKFAVLSAPSEAGLASALPPIGPVDHKFLEQRERKRIEELKSEKQHRNKDVSAEGQAIYDALRRVNVPVRWHHTQIIAHEAVIIKEPYDVADCSANAGKQDVLNRTKKVLEGERRKLRERQDSQRKTATPTGPRKGG